MKYEEKLSPESDRKCWRFEGMWESRKEYLAYRMGKWIYEGDVIESSGSVDSPFEI